MDTCLVKAGCHREGVCLSVTPGNRALVRVGVTTASRRGSRFDILKVLSKGVLSLAPWCVAPDSWLAELSRFCICPHGPWPRTMVGKI